MKVRRSNTESMCGNERDDTNGEDAVSGGGGVL